MPSQLVKRLAGTRGVEEILEPFLPWLLSALGGHSRVKSATLRTVDFLFTAGSMLFVHCAQMGMPMVSRRRGELSEGPEAGPHRCLSWLSK